MRLRSVIFLIAIAISAGACSGGSATDTSNIGGAPNAQPSNVAAASNAANSDPSEQPQPPTADNRTGPFKRRLRPQVGVASGSPAPLEFRPGAEDSEIATTMNEQGQPLEIRQFKDNPQLARAEAVWLGSSEKLLRITLRNGQTVEVRTDKIANLASAPVSLLVELAGGSK